jgi:hypothetical protein
MIGKNCAYAADELDREFKRTCSFLTDDEIFISQSRIEPIQKEGGCGILVFGYDPVI